MTGRQSSQVLLFTENYYPIIIISVQIILVQSFINVAEKQSQKKSLDVFSMQAKIAEAAAAAQCKDKFSEVLHYITGLQSLIKLTYRTYKH